MIASVFQQRVETYARCFVVLLDLPSFISNFLTDIDCSEHMKHKLALSPPAPCSSERLQMAHLPAIDWPRLYASHVQENIGGVSQNSSPTLYLVCRRSSGDLMMCTLESACCLGARSLKAPITQAISHSVTWGLQPHEI